MRIWRYEDMRIWGHTWTPSVLRPAASLSRKEIGMGRRMQGPPKVKARGCPWCYSSHLILIRTSFYFCCFWIDSWRYFVFCQYEWSLKILGWTVLSCEIPCWERKVTLVSLDSALVTRLKLSRLLKWEIVTNIPSSSFSSLTPLYICKENMS